MDPRTTPATREPQPPSPDDADGATHRPGMPPDANPPLTIHDGIPPRLGNTGGAVRGPGGMSKTGG